MTDSKKTNVVVVGAGAVGAMALWQLSKQPDLEVVGIEQYGRVHSHGSYAGESRVFRTAVHEGGSYVPMIQRSRELWRALEQESGREIYREVGCLSIAPEGFPDLLSTLRTIEDFALPHRMLSNEELRREYPQHLVGDEDVAVFDEQGGGLRPEVAIMSALELAEANGATLHFNTAVLEIESRSTGVIVRTTQGTVHADRVVIASGSWSTRLMPELQDLLRIQVIGLTWMLPRDPALYAPERFPAFLRDVGDVHFFGAPSFDGYAFKACTNPKWPVYRDVEGIPTSHSREELIRIGQRAVELFDGVSPEPVRESVHHCAYTPDRLPVIDQSADERIITVTGLSGHGFKFAPALGEYAAQLAAGLDPHIDQRFSLSSRLRALDELGPYQGGGH